MPQPSKTDRREILTVAFEHVSRHGIDKLTIRGVAAALDLTPNALYRYFDSLAALEEALADESRRQLLAVLQGAGGKEPAERAIRSIARAYVKFAREHAHVFALTLRAPSDEAGDEAAHVKSWLFVVSQVARIYGQENAPKAAIALWAFLHGLTVLEAAGVFGERKPISGFDFGLQLWIEGASR